jgi:hypothetical protein
MSRITKNSQSPINRSTDVKSFRFKNSTPKSSEYKSPITGSTSAGSIRSFRSDSLQSVRSPRSPRSRSTSISVESKNPELTQEELDRYLFENKNSINPFLDDSGNVIIYTENDSLTLTRTNKILGEGSYGRVYVYEHGSIRYAVKFALPNANGEIDDGNERKAVLELRNVYLRNNIWCNVIKARIVDSSNKYATLMPVMDGNLYDLMELDVLTTEDKKEILESLRQQMECIINLNLREVIEDKKQENFKFAYLDLKPGNILYKKVTVDGKTKYSCLLGDLGSILRNENNDFISSYPVKTKVNLRRFSMLSDDFVLGVPRSLRAKIFNYPRDYIVDSMRYVFGINAFYIFSGKVKLDPKERDLIAMNNYLRINLGEDYVNLIIDDTAIVRTSMYN